MIKFVALIEGPDLERKLSLLLDAAKVAGVPMELGVVVADLPSRRKSQRKGRSTKGAKRPKRHPGKMSVKLGTRPEGPPRLVEVHQTLYKEFGTVPFEKRLAKGVLIKKLKMTGASGQVSALMNRGGLVPA
jgi:hypothetical protein